MTISDSHIHLFANGYPGRYGTLFPGGQEVTVYEKIRQAHGIDQALVVGFEGAAWSRGNNRYLAELALSHSWITPLAFYSLASPLRPGSLKKWWDEGFYGISLYVFDGGEVERLADAPEQWVRNLNEKRAILSVNCPPEIAVKLRPLWRRLSQTRILFSHLGLPGPIRQAARKIKSSCRLADLPHVGVKLSGAYGINAYPHPGLPELMEELLYAYGENRLYWGSDFSPALDQVSYEQTITVVANLLKLNLSKLMGENLRAAISRVNQQGPSL